MRALLLLFALLVAACSPRDDAPATDGSATRYGTDSVAGRSDSTVPLDSTARPDSAATADSGRPTGKTGAATSPLEPDTTASKVLVTTTSAAVLGDSVLKRDSIIGRDSAFGPKFRIDSTGKLVRIRRP